MSEPNVVRSFHEPLVLQGPVCNLMSEALDILHESASMGGQNPSVDFGKHPTRFLRCLGEARCQGLAEIRLAGATKRHRVGHTSWQGGLCSHSWDGPITCCEWSGLWRCLAIPTSVVWNIESNSIPAMGGMGLRDASRTSQPAFWASWADCLSMVHDRHPNVATMMVRQLSGVDDCESPSLQAASRAARELTGVESFEVPSWNALVRGTRPPPHEVDDCEPGEARHGWQHEAASRVERLFRSHSMERLATRTNLVALPERAHGWHGSFCHALPTSLPASNPTFSGWSCCTVSVFLSSSDSLGHHLPLDCAEKEAPEWCFATWTFQCLLYEVGGG